MASNHQRTVEEPQCCFKLCGEQGNSSRVLSSDCSKVEVKAYEPKKRGNWLVDWAQDGSATFHKHCWKLLVRSTKGSDKTGLDLSDNERSMILEAKKTAEFHDGDLVIDKEASHIADIIKHSKYCIAFTGAGISTAAGIGDFRGKNGKWTQRHKAKNFGSKPSKEDRKLIMEQLRPTYTHEALCKLVDVGVLKFIISQNVDGLHCLSGVPAEKLSELHGNTFVERCEDCGTRYELKHHWRRAPVGSFPPKSCNKCKLSHRTGRKCTQQGCKGYVMNTIINFGDSLESHVLSTAEHHALLADCVLILGSSLTVSPANGLVMMGQEPVRLIIINRQTTPYDDVCEDEDSPGARVYGDCDILMQKVMQQLLSPEMLKDWDAGKETRALQYDMQRGV